MIFETEVGRSKMAFCPNCGSKNKENSKYCIECGHQLLLENQTEDTTHIPTQYSAKQMISKTTISKNKSKIMVGVLLLFVGLIIVIAISGSGNDEDISPYVEWSFTSAEDSYRTNVPNGYSFVTVDINIKNDGKESISTDPSSWEFISDGISYSYDVISTTIPTQFKVEPGEEFTFCIHYVVEGIPTSASLSYIGSADSTDSNDKKSNTGYTSSDYSKYGTSADEAQEKIEELQEKNRKMKEDRLVDDVDYF